MQPDTRYARVGRERIAYQVLGEGPVDLVFTPGSFGNVDTVWEDPAAALFLRRLASFTRLIRFDRRGTSSSDPLPLDALPPWESYADEVRAVLDEVRSEHAAIMAMLDAGPMAMLFAATFPDRTTALILANTTARWVVAEDFREGIPLELAESVVERLDQAWGTEAMAAFQAPSRAGDEAFRRWYAKFTRSIAGPSAVQAFVRALFQTDARPLLRSIQAPTLVMHRAGYPLLSLDHGRYLAAHVCGARLLELPGSDGPVYWEHPETVLAAVEEFLTGVRPIVDVGRSLATILFTDIVGSTAMARELGDQRWRALLDVHDEVARRRVVEGGGRLIKTTGDGILSAFDGPGRGIRAARAILEDLRAVGLSIRAGIHAGEVDCRGDDIGGIAVHIAARVMGKAGPGEVLVSRTVRDLVTGSGIRFDERGAHDLKGVEGDWQLFAVAPA